MTGQQAASTDTGLPLVDCHVHLWGTGDGDSGIVVSRRYRRSMARVRSTTWPG